MDAPRQLGERCPHCGAQRAERAATEIATWIGRAYGYSLAELRAPNRSRDRVAVRLLISCVLREQGYSLSVIGLALNRDHTTILSGLQTVERAQEAGVASALPAPPFRLAGALREGME